MLILLAIRVFLDGGGGVRILAFLALLCVQRKLSCQAQKPGIGDLYQAFNCCITAVGVKNQKFNKNTGQKHDMLPFVVEYE